MSSSVSPLSWRRSGSGSWAGIGTVALGGSAVRVLDPDIRAIAFQRVLAFPLAVWIAVAMFLLALFLERRTRFGRYIYAIGEGEYIATLSGVPVKRTRILAFTLAGFFTGVAAVLAAAQLGKRIQRSRTAVCL